MTDAIDEIKHFSRGVAIFRISAGQIFLNVGSCLLKLAALNQSLGREHMRHGILIGGAFQKRKGFGDVLVLLDE